MEIMKQGIHQPLPVSRQIAIIFAGVNGFLDDIALKDIRAFEQRLNDFIDASYPDYDKKFNQKLVMDDEVKGMLNTILTEAKARSGK